MTVIGIARPTGIKQPLLCLLLSVAVSCGSPVSSSHKLPTEDSAGKEIRVQGLQKIAELPGSEHPHSIQCHGEELCWLDDSKRLWQSRDGGRRWEQINALAEDHAVKGYTFIDSRSGWRISRSALERTTDGGRRWEQQTTPFGPARGEIHTAQFLKDSKTIWLAGGLYRPKTREEVKSGVPNNTNDVTGKNVLEEAIFRSDDGGQTWRRQVLAPGGVGRILSLYFFDQNHGMALSETWVYYTDNGGRAWKQPDFSERCVRKEYLDDYYEARPQGVAMLNSTQWWLSYTDGRIVKSLDGGRSWCDLLHPGEVDFDKPGKAYFTAIKFKNSSQGWGLGWDKFLYETNDGGFNWSRLSPDIQFDYMYFPDDKHALLISKRDLFRLTL